MSEVKKLDDVLERAIDQPVIIINTDESIKFYETHPNVKDIVDKIIHYEMNADYLKNRLRLDMKKSLFVGNAQGTNDLGIYLKRFIKHVERSGVPINGREIFDSMCRLDVPKRYGREIFDTMPISDVAKKLDKHDDEFYYFTERQITLFQMKMLRHVLSEILSKQYRHFYNIRVRNSSHGKLVNFIIHIEDRGKKITKELSYNMKNKDFVTKIIASLPEIYADIMVIMDKYQTD